MFPILLFIGLVIFFSFILNRVQKKRRDAIDRLPDHRDRKPVDRKHLKVVE